MKPESSRRALVPQKSTIAPIVLHTPSELHSGKYKEIEIQKPRFTSEKLGTILSYQEQGGQQNCFGTLLKRDFQKLQDLGILP